MLQFSKVLASLCAGCLCTLTIHQIPALGNVLLPQTHAIPETSPIRPVDVMPLEPLPTPAETAPAMSIPPTETQSPQTQTTAAVATAVTVLTATATTTIPPETTAATESETTVAVTSTIPESDPFFQEHETWFKAYMDYCTITDTDSVQYAMVFTIEFTKKVFAKIRSTLVGRAAKTSAPADGESVQGENSLIFCRNLRRSLCRVGSPPVTQTPWRIPCLFFR